VREQALAAPSAWAMIKPILVATLLLVGLGGFNPHCATQTPRAWAAAHFRSRQPHPMLQQGPVYSQQGPVLMLRDRPRRRDGDVCSSKDSQERLATHQGLASGHVHSRQSPTRCPAQAASPRPASHLLSHCGTMARLIMFTAVAGLIMFTAVGLVPGVHYAGASHLLGAFLAGFCFCSDPRSHHVWVRQVKRIMYWLLTLFFGCTIGFEVPVRTMFTGPVIGAASCYFIAIVGKVLVGLWAKPRTKYGPHRARQTPGRALGALRVRALCALFVRFSGRIRQSPYPL
jgi:hypothetical protein